PRSVRELHPGRQAAARSAEGARLADLLPHLQRSRLRCQQVRHEAGVGIPPLLRGAGMNRREQAIGWTGIVAVVTLIATHGEAFFAALLGFPRLIAAWSSQMPFGALSFLLSLGLAVGACAFTLRWLPVCRNDAS